MTLQRPETVMVPGYGAVPVVRSQRRSVSLQVSAQGEPSVRAPLRMERAQIADFVSDKGPWLADALAKMQSRARENAKRIPWTDLEIRDFARKAMADLPPRVRHYAAVIGVSYGRITIRHQKTRWGSCSAKGNLNFNCMLEAAPERVRDYVVVHELCHRREMNHSPRFWALVERYMPDYRSSREWLRDHAWLSEYRQ